MSRDTLRVIARGLRSTLLGALIGASLCVLGYLPALAVDSTSGADDRSIWVGVVLIGARAGAVVGLIFFLIKRSLTGEVEDPSATARDSLSSRLRKSG
jgi:hypothetical protein